MTTWLIVLCAVLCVVVGAGILAFLGIGIEKDRTWRRQMRRRDASRRRGRRIPH